MQRIWRKRLIFCVRLKRLVRKTVCFSKFWVVHFVVFGLVIVVLEFGNKLI
ncbi:MAG: IS1 family transposase [Nitrososphaerota archaeon]|nr:IS1 family transposase [Nitrososphaerota archaeon]